MTHGKKKTPAWAGAVLGGECRFAVTGDRDDDADDVPSVPPGCCGLVPEMQSTTNRLRSNYDTSGSGARPRRLGWRRGLLLLLLLFRRYALFQTVLEFVLVGRIGHVEQAEAVDRLGLEQTSRHLLGLVGKQRRMRVTRDPHLDFLLRQLGWDHQSAAVGDQPLLGVTLQELQSDIADLHQRCLQPDRDLAQPSR